MNKIFMSAVFLILSFSYTSAQEAYENELWWALDDSGVVECPARFIALGLAPCLPGGIDAAPHLGRRCAMGFAIAMAKNNQCQAAFEMSKATACHNGAGEANISRAGPQKICTFLSTLGPY